MMTPINIELPGGITLVKMLEMKLPVGFYFCIQMWNIRGLNYRSGR